MGNERDAFFDKGFWRDSNLETLKKEHESWSKGQKGMGREPLSFNDWLQTYKQPKTP
jgi:hypothetical protein